MTFSSVTTAELPIADRVRTRLLEQGRDASAANIVRALRNEGIVLDERGLMDVVDRVQYELLGAGPLEDFLQDESVTDVLVTGDGHVWVDAGDGLEDRGRCFNDPSHLRRIAARLASRAGRRLDEAAPFVDARLPNGIRLHCVIEPIATDGACLSLRIPKAGGFSLEALEEAGTLDDASARLVRELIDSRRSFLITGSTGSGKTTVLSALLGAVPADERIVIVEDTAELQPDHPHVVRMQSRPANVEGAGLVTLQDLVRQSLRMRPDRIVVGEVRGVEVVDLLTALNTGHQGGSGTVHANSPADVTKRIEALGLMAGVPRDAMHALMAAAVDAVVHVERIHTGLRVISGVHAINSDGHLCTTTPVYVRESRTRPSTW
jgi:pilus assembly protein CpaF